jgi:putative endonuclease
VQYVYVLESLSNSKRYVGSTGQDLSERVRQHNRGATSWARRNGPFKLLYWEEYPDKTVALRRERFLKTGVGRRIRDELVRTRGGTTEVSSAGG